MVEKRFWTREEFIVTFNLYLKLSFGQMNSNNKETARRGSSLK